jgi:hypothetical protein
MTDVSRSPRAAITPVIIARSPCGSEAIGTAFARLRVYQRARRLRAITSGGAASAIAPTKISVVSRSGTD